MCKVITYQVSKDDFIAAYCYSYGATKKAALQAWKTSSNNYKKYLVDGYKMECKKGFYND